MENWLNENKKSEIQWSENQLSVKIKFKFDQINRANTISLAKYYCYHLQIVV